MTHTPPLYVAHDIPDLINSLPTLFGFRPRESLVAVATNGPRHRLGFRLRLDIPAPEDVDGAAAFVVAHLVNQGAEGAIVIAVTQHQEVALDLLDAVHDELDVAGVRLVIRARADGQRYWTDEVGSSPLGTAYETSGHHLSIVQAVAAGQQILPDREALVERFAAVTGERRHWLEQAAATIVAEVVPVVARTAPDDLPAVGMEVVGPILERALASRRVSDADLLRVAAWVSSIGVRDAVWSLIDRDNAEEMLRVLTLVSGSVVPPFEPAVLSLTGFAAWLTGDGAQALIAIERALRADPDYSMARLFLEVIERGVSPSHWQGFDLEEPRRAAPR
ncbi:DUF4192 domain-containing protein [Aeromicrobium wangtongii]|uniref:DUF4192 domain-containing protein n=1 Tax=Aeromicrobium wangtongii TaxID=2969247 RepID=A0ABY5MDA5_9ACTN|nr:DUF4192 domain-containing protein [Aeromicrobium wangtongii]MCD9197636.1 DUF4192 domain-containing protein [Aeromicrobium wangtongii]UUP15123.1 DUF4192 domain-containing protein [Aeromicrobium wangtongii]